MDVFYNISQGHSGWSCRSPIYHDSTSRNLCVCNGEVPIVELATVEAVQIQRVLDDDRWRNYEPDSDIL
jgi:hypothetical protein